MDYKSLKEKLEKIIGFEQRLRAVGPVLQEYETGEYHKLIEELKNVGYEDLKNYHSNAILEIEILKKQYKNEILPYEMAGKLMKNKIDMLRKIINSDREIRITDVE